MNEAHSHVNIFVSAHNLAGWAIESSFGGVEMRKRPEGWLANRARNDCGCLLRLRRGNSRKGFQARKAHVSQEVVKTTDGCIGDFESAHMEKPRTPCDERGFEVLSQHPSMF